MAPHHPPTVTSFTREQVTLDSGSILAKLPIIGAILAVLGLGGTFALGMGDQVNMYASYTTAFMFWLSIAVGAFFFVTIFFLTRSAWNVTVRRTAETAMATLPVFLLLFIPMIDRKSTRLNSSHVAISYAVFCLKKKTLHFVITHI